MSTHKWCPSAVWGYIEQRFLPRSKGGNLRLVQYPAGLVVFVLGRCGIDVAKDRQPTWILENTFTLSTLQCGANSVGAVLYTVKPQTQSKIVPLF